MFTFSVSFFMFSAEKVDSLRISAHIKGMEPDIFIFLSDFSHFPTVKAGKSKSLRSDRRVDLAEEGVREDKWYHLKTYTALRVVRGPSLEHHKRITFFHE